MALGYRPKTEVGASLVQLELIDGRLMEIPPRMESGDGFSRGNLQRLNGMDFALGGEEFRFEFDDKKEGIPVRVKIRRTDGLLAHFVDLNDISNIFNEVEIHWTVSMNYPRIKGALVASRNFVQV